MGMTMVATGTESLETNSTYMYLPTEKNQHDELQFFNVKTVHTQTYGIPAVDERFIRDHKLEKAIGH